MTIYKLTGNRGLIFYCTFPNLTKEDAENVYKNHFDNKAEMDIFNIVNTTFPNIFHSDRRFK